MKINDEYDGKWNKPVEVVCYNNLTIFETRSEARQFYTTALNMSEGSEKERYVNIVVDLITTDSRMVHDKVNSEPLILKIGKYVNGKYQMLRKCETLIAYSDYLRSRQGETTQNDMKMSL